MVACPQCHGAKGREVRPTHGAGCWEHECFCSSKARWVPCRTCRGDGEISEAELGIYKARGGPAPTPMKGYA